MPPLDQESEKILSALADREKVRSRRFPAVRTVFIVLSSAGMVYGMDALRQNVLLSYPDVAVFFYSTSGKPMGIPAPRRVDLLIDLTGPGQRQSSFLAWKFRRRARYVVGRNKGWFRRMTYDRIFNEFASVVPGDPLSRERVVQAQVLALAGVALAQTGEVLLEKVPSRFS